MEQRLTFDQVADLYLATRPDYPEALIEDVLSHADLKPNDKILEVGCGSGQATKSFAKRGFPIVAIDPGAEMLRGARTGPWRVGLLAACLSLLIESLQFAWGGRCADVDDVMLNTIGGLLGYGLWVAACHVVRAVGGMGPSPLGQGVEAN